MTVYKVWLQVEQDSSEEYEAGETACEYRNIGEPDIIGTFDTAPEAEAFRDALLFVLAHSDGRWIREVAPNALAGLDPAALADLIGAAQFVSDCDPDMDGACSECSKRTRAALARLRGDA